MEILKICTKPTICYTSSRSLLLLAITYDMTCKQTQTSILSSFARYFHGRGKHRNYIKKNILAVVLGCAGITNCKVPGMNWSSFLDAHRNLFTCPNICIPAVFFNQMVSRYINVDFIYHYIAVFQDPWNNHLFGITWYIKTCMQLWLLTTALSLTSL